MIGLKVTGGATNVRMFGTLVGIGGILTGGTDCDMALVKPEKTVAMMTVYTLNCLIFISRANKDV